MTELQMWANTFNLPVHQATHTETDGEMKGVALKLTIKKQEQNRRFQKCHKNA